MLSFSGWQGNDMETICGSLDERGTYYERAEIELVKVLALQTANAASATKARR